jgi:hypothetical protein
VPISKRDTTIGAVLALLLLIGGKKALAATAPKGAPKAGGAPPPPPDPKADGAALLKRADQSGAAAWTAVFSDLPGRVLSPLTARALSRWAGIESSGIPVGPKNPSRLDERGLMQAGPSAVTDGLLSAAEFAALKDPKTTRAQHAALSVKYVDALANKAMTYVAAPPADPVDLIWYAKLWHQRPVDVRDAGLRTDGKQGMTGDALGDARKLAEVWAVNAATARAAGDAEGAKRWDRALHRLRAANVIAWGAAAP